MPAQVTARQQALLDAAALCRQYAENLSQLPNGRDVALECAAMIEEEAQEVLTSAENGSGSCQAESAVLNQLIDNVLIGRR